MKIICVDNFDRDHLPDKLVADHVDEHYAEYICNKLNERFSGMRSNDYFRVVPEDHKLNTGDPR